MFFGLKEVCTHELFFNNSQIEQRHWRSINNETNRDWHSHFEYLVEEVIQMMRKLRELAILNASLFLFAMLFIATNAIGQSIPFEQNMQIPWYQTNFRYDVFSTTLLTSQYGRIFNLPYQSISGSWLQSPSMFLSSPNTQWASSFSFDQAALPSYFPQGGFGSQGVFNIEPLPSGLPYGCEPVWEKRRPVLFDSFTTPIYCPVFIPRFIQLTSNL